MSVINLESLTIDRRERSELVGAHIARSKSKRVRGNRVTTLPRCLISRLEKTQMLRGNLHGIESLKSTLIGSRAEKERKRVRGERGERKSVWRKRHSFYFEKLHAMDSERYLNTKGKRYKSKTILYLTLIKMLWLEERSSIFSIYWRRAETGEGEAEKAYGARDTYSQKYLL